MNNIFLKILEEERERLLGKLRAIEEVLFVYKDAIANDYVVKLQDNIYINLNTVINNHGPNFFQKYSNYDPAFSTRQKIVFIIKHENRFLHVREIARIIQLLEDSESIQQLIRKLSPALCHLKKDLNERLVSIAANGLHFNTFWGCKDWITEDGRIHTSFMYNLSEITKGKTKLMHSITESLLL